MDAYMFGSTPLSLAKCMAMTLGSKEHCLRLYRKDNKRDCHTPLRYVRNDKRGAFGIQKMDACMFAGILRMGILRMRLKLRELGKMPASKQRTHAGIQRMDACIFARFTRKMLAHFKIRGRLKLRELGKMLAGI
jgi:hypothetical protein